MKLKDEIDMSCLNCIHIDMCQRVDVNNNRFCTHFKDKNKIIELPCKVGDTVYIIPAEHNAFEEITAMKCIDIIIGKPNNVVTLRGKGVVSTYQPSFKMFGYTVFLSKANAENKLKGGKI